MTLTALLERRSEHALDGSPARVLAHTGILDQLTDVQPVGWRPARLSRCGLVALESVANR